MFYGILIDDMVYSSFNLFYECDWLGVGVCWGGIFY